MKIKRYLSRLSEDKEKDDSLQPDKLQDSQIGVAGDHAHVEGGINFNTLIKVITSRWVIAPLLVLIFLVGIIALNSVPNLQEQLRKRGLLPTCTPTPLPFPPEKDEEVLIVVAQFYHTEGVVDTAPSDEIKRAIEQERGNLNLRAEVVPTRLKAGDRIGAEMLGDCYDASLIIWGADTGVRVTVNFYNRKQPDTLAADVQIEETLRTQIASPSEYAELITKDLPKQLTFLALFAIGQLYYTEKTYAESAQIIERAVASFEQQTGVIEGIAEAYFRLGWLYQIAFDDCEKAQDAYTHALEFDLQYAKAYNNRGITYYDIGESDSALDDYTQAIEFDDKFVEAYYNRGIIYCDKGNYEHALADYTRALELDPELAEAYNNRGLVYYVRGRVCPDQIQSIINFPKQLSILQVGPIAKASYMNRAVSSFEIDEYNPWGNICPEYMNDYDLALADFTHAIELNPKLAKAYCNRANIYLDMGEYENALADFEHAKELIQDATFHYYVAYKFASLGHPDEACASLADAITLDAQLRDYACTDPNLDPIRDAPCFQALMQGK